MAKWEEWDFATQTGTKLPSGGIYPPYGHIGHWEVTAKVIEELGFSAPASDILCDAAQDPDFYEFSKPAAHAQTPDKADLCGSDSNKRAAIIAKAVKDYVKWVEDCFSKSRSALKKGDTRLSLYWLGYALHGIEDLAVHQGITNGEHASAKDNPDFQAEDVALSYVYARRMLDTVRNALGQNGFDSLRNFNGQGKFSFLEKHNKKIHPGGWDIDNHFDEFNQAGKKYEELDPKPDPVRWDREVVLSQVLESVLTQRFKHIKTVRSLRSTDSENPHRRFEALTPTKPLSTVAEWAVLVYMAGDDRNPNGIEYAISQDLTELKQIGSRDEVHFLVQTDDATGSASYRYRLREGTDLASDRLARFNGDLNTGSTKTLVDFVRWAHHLFPAKRTALVLWGHGSGHDDQNVYRAVRGAVTPRTAARLAQRRLGFFSGTRRSILEQGPTRGYGYDDTAGDFLDNVELHKALRQIKTILGRPLDILGFDACLMAMIEVAYQIHDTAKILVASERTEPGDGWWYSRAFHNLLDHPETAAPELAQDIVSAYRMAYRNDMTLSAVNMEEIITLASKITDWTREADPADFHVIRRSALDCSPRPGDGYCDLGSFLEAAADDGRQGASEAGIARTILRRAILASCGMASGLTIYAPGNFRPQQAGSTDALYLSLDFVRKEGWGTFLKKVYPPLTKPAPSGDNLLVPTPATGLDRFTARHILAAVRSKAGESWLDRLRTELLAPCGKIVTATAKQIDKLDPPKNPNKSPAAAKKGGLPAEKRRILILPGIMGSLLHDRSGKLGAVWIDPWNLVFGDDFKALQLKWQTEIAGEASKSTVNPLSLPKLIPDGDDAVRIEAYRTVPLIYDRMALALMHKFGPVVEYVPYDWRQPIQYLGQGLATRIKTLADQYRDMEIVLVAHSMGGLVATDALTRLLVDSSQSLDTVKAFVVMGTPFLGAGKTLKSLRAEKNDLKLLNENSSGDIKNTVQTFRGLYDMLPQNQVELLKPGLYAPGPLSRLLPGDDRLTSPLRIVRELPPTIQLRTTAIYCTTKNTIGTVIVREDDTVDYSDLVAGDGTVSMMSALNGGALLPNSHEVNEGHMTLPLNGKAIEYSIDWIGRHLGSATTKTILRDWPAAPEIRLPVNREELIQHLEAEDELTLGDYMALLSLL